MGDQHPRGVHHQARDNGRSHAPVLVSPFGGEIHLDRGAIQREPKQMMGPASPDARFLPEELQDFLACQTDGYIASLRTSHPIEDGIHPQGRLDEDYVLVVLPDAASMRLATA